MKPKTDNKTPSDAKTGTVPEKVSFRAQIAAVRGAIKLEGLRDGQGELLLWVPRADKPQLYLVDHYMPERRLRVTIEITED